MKAKQLLISIGIIGALALFYSYFAFSKPFDFSKSTIQGRNAKSPQAPSGTAEKFEYLSEKRSNSCSLQREAVLSYSDTTNLQGSCCGPMQLHEYQEQVEGLKKFSSIPQIPQDPYDIPVTLAKELFDYQKNIELTLEQQKVYDEAMKLSHEGGPCCCKCWRWTAFEGQAKYLITQHNFTSDQIAKIWDLEDGCGGDDHHHAT